MNAKDVFGLVVRVGGLGLISYGVRYLMSAVYVLARPNTDQGWGAADYVVSALLFLSVGLFLLRRAQCVVGFAYPERESQSAEPEKGDDVPQ
jgi:hypothetical protein